MTKAEAERLLEAIETTCDDLISGIGSETSATVQAQRVGMTVLKEYLLKTLDFRGFASDEAQVDEGELKALVERYCRECCPASRMIQPGSAPACMRCPLRNISIDPLLRQTSRAGSP